MASGGYIVSDTRDFSLPPTVIQLQSEARMLGFSAEAYYIKCLKLPVLRHSRSESDVSLSESSRSGSSLLGDGSQHEDKSAEMMHMVCASSSTVSGQSSADSNHMTATVMVTVATTGGTPTSSMQAAINPNLPSAGSAQHDQGQCKPCCFFRRGKCVKGLDCDFCHFVHPNIGPRPGKTSRDRDKAKAARVARTVRAWEGGGTLPGPWREFVEARKQEAQAHTPGANDGWVDELVFDVSDLATRVRAAKESKRVVSFGYVGSVGRSLTKKDRMWLDVWEKFDQEGIMIELGADQTSLHNPWAGGPCSALRQRQL